MLLVVLEYIDADSIGRFRSVCHRFHAVASSGFYDVDCICVQGFRLIKISFGR
jgi:hypothetical protein